MRMTRRLTLVAGFVAVTFGSIHALSAAETLKVGSYPANPPWQFKNEAGEFEGFEVDIVREIAERLGRDIDIQGLDFKALFAATASKRVDMVISSLTITPDRLENQSFTQPYFEGGLGVAVRTDSDITSLADLKGKKVGSIATSTPEAWLQEHKDEVGYASYSSFDSTSNMLTALASGRIDAAVNDVVGLRYTFTKMDGLRVADEIVTGEKFAIMMPKDSELLTQVNDIISDMKTDGTMARLYMKWFGVEPAEGSFTVTPLPVPTLAD